MYAYGERVTASTAPDSTVVSVTVVTGSLCSITAPLGDGPYDVRATPPNPPRFAPPKERGRWWERRSEERR
jgi:hypothetical protein